MAVYPRNHNDYQAPRIGLQLHSPEFQLPPNLIEQLRRRLQPQASGDSATDSSDGALLGYALAHAEPLAGALAGDRSSTSLLIERTGLSSAFLEENPPFLFRAEISSDRLDSYYTHMDPLTTLPNFAEDARAGVAFLNSHRWMELGFGRSYDATFNEGTARRSATVTADFYTIPDLQLNGVSTNDLIRGIESRIVSDVSVGFGGGDWTCDLCGLSLMSWDCVHYPGMKYEQDSVEWLADSDPADRMVWMSDLSAGEFDIRAFPRLEVRARKKKKQYVTATAMVVDARLHEVSAVYDGATPGAAIRKAQRAVEAGRIPPGVERFIEQRYRVRIADPNRIYAAGSLPAPESRATIGVARQESPMENRPAAQEATPAVNQGLPVEFASLFRDLRAALPINSQEGAEPPSDAAYLALAVEAVRRIPNLEERVRQLEAETSRLEPLAAMGTQYREALIEACVKEGVRALGAAFNVEATTKLLEGQGIDLIEAQRQQYQAVATARFPGGAVVQDAPSVPAAETLSQRLAVAAYQA